MLNIPSLTRAALLAVSISTMAPALVPLAHAQSAPVSFPGDGWSATVPGDWQVINAAAGVQAVQGNLASGSPANFTVAREAVPDGTTVAAYLAAFKSRPEMAAVAFNQENPNDKCAGGVACATGLFVSQDRIGMYATWIEKGQGWLLFASVLSTDPAAFTAGMGDLGTIIQSFKTA